MAGRRENRREQHQIGTRFFRIAQSGQAMRGRCHQPGSGQIQPAAGAIFGKMNAVGLETPRQATIAGNQQADATGARLPTEFAAEDGAIRMMIGTQDQDGAAWQGRRVRSGLAIGQSDQAGQTAPRLQAACSLC